MAQRICCYCGIGLADEQNPHSYKECIVWLTAQISNHQGHLDTYYKRLEDVKSLVKKGKLQ